jgi:predicted transcriptional regulator
VESFSKLDVIVIILKSAHKNRDYEEIYSKIQAQLTMSQFMKFIFELKKYNLLKSMGSEAHYVITPKGMQYLRIHDELTGQMRSETAKNSHIFEYCNSVFKLTNFFKKKNNILESI